MNFNLGSNSTKMILLVVSGIALLLALNMYQKALGQNVAILLSVLTLAVVGFFGYQLLNEEEVVENDVDDELLNELLNNKVMPNNNVVMNANVQEPLEVVENFQGNTDVPVAEETSTEPTTTTVSEPTTLTVSEPTTNVSEDTSSTIKLNGNGLLPGDTNTLFNNTNPSPDGGVINASLLNAGHHFGIDTQGCSLRNANRGLRSEPPNPQVQVSPWLQTTICPDLMRKPLDCPLDN